MRSGRDEWMEEKRSRVIEDEDDEGRRISPRKKPRDSPTLNTHTQREHNRLLDVSCGNKKGILDTEKLSKSEKCIRCDDCWLTPPEFEHYAGKGSSKKWKATIFFENQPLKFWLEKGHLTTKGFKCRQAKTKKQKIVLSSGSSSEDSEIESEEETKDDDVEDRDWLPGNETEEEGEEGRVWAGADSDADQSEEEEDKAATHNKGKQVFEEMEAKPILSDQERPLREVKIILTRLPEAGNDCQSRCTEDSPEDAQTGRVQNGSTADEPSPLAAAASTDPSPTSDSPPTGCVVEENGEEDTQSHERKEGEQSDTVPETGNSPSPPSPPSPVSCFLDVESESEDRETERISFSGSEASQPFEKGNVSDAATNTSPVQRNIKEEMMATTNATTSGHDAAELQVIREDTGSLQESQAAGNTQSSDISCDLDTMDLDQLRRVKTKMQIKVLKLQEEYYTQKIKELKKIHQSL